MTTPVPEFSDPVEAHRFAEYRQAQAEEYGTWVAAEAIDIAGVLAFGVGHPVPKSTVERMGWDQDGRVVPAGTPLPEPGQNRERQLQERQAAIKRENEAIEAELRSRRSAQRKANPSKEA